MDDLIKRRDVLEDIDEGADLLRTILDEMDLVGSDREEFEFGLELLGALIDDIKQIPPAEPETCAYWDGESNICALHRPSAVPDSYKGRQDEQQEDDLS